tara:strand:+ start:13550 stop:13672 length:123 start_codon:yes stop_codon:yes gene_type:complete
MERCCVSDLSFQFQDGIRFADVSFEEVKPAVKKPVFVTLK